MSLEELYLTAQDGTYVGAVLRKQAPYTANNAPAADSGLVNFMDGTRRNGREVDEFQTEFKRNAAGAFVIGGGQGVLGRGTTGTLTRWTDRAFNLAFEGKGKGPASLVDGFYDTNKYRVAETPKSVTTVHLYTPLEGQGYVNKNTSAGIRYNGGASLAPTNFGGSGGGGTGGGRR